MFLLPIIPPIVNAESTADPQVVFVQRVTHYDPECALRGARVRDAGRGPP
jgi:hypothetical protein